MSYSRIKGHSALYLAFRGRLSLMSARSWFRQDTRDNVHPGGMGGRGRSRREEDEHVEGASEVDNGGCSVGEYKSSCVETSRGIYIPRLGNRASEGFQSNKTPGCIEGTEISSNEGCKLKINSNLNNWNDLRPLRGGE